MNEKQPVVIREEPSIGKDQRNKVKLIYSLI